MQTVNTAKLKEAEAREAELCRSLAAAQVLLDMADFFPSNLLRCANLLERTETSTYTRGLEIRS
jgi:hypothetical protein